MKTERGKKTRAGQLLSAFLRQIAEEPTELIKDGGEDRIATKAEALARQMWKDALGYREIVPVIDKDGKTIGSNEVIHAPNRAMMELVFNRIEGRAPIAVQEGDEKITVTERVSEEGKKRIGKAGGL